MAANYAVQDSRKLKVVVLGANAVGKTALFHQFLGTVPPIEYEQSATVNIGAKLVQLDRSARTVIELWDVPHALYSGPDMLAQYLSGAQALVLVYSLLEPSSWRALPVYVDHARELALDVAATSIAVVGNKCDTVLVDADDATRAEASTWAQHQAFARVEVSALRDAAAVLGIFKMVLGNI